MVEGSVRSGSDVEQRGGLSGKAVKWKRESVWWREPGFESLYRGCARR
jgi:hypothetical protein